MDRDEHRQSVSLAAHEESLSRQAIRGTYLSSTAGTPHETRSEAAHAVGFVAARAARRGRTTPKTWQLASLGERVSVAERYVVLEEHRREGSAGSVERLCLEDRNTCRKTVTQDRSAHRARWKADQRQRNTHVELSPSLA